MKEPKQKQKNDSHGRRIIALTAVIRRQNQEEISSDVMGSYTGMDENGEIPEQDADDL